MQSTLGFSFVLVFPFSLTLDMALKVGKKNKTKTIGTQLPHPLLLLLKGLGFLQPKLSKSLRL